MVYRSLINPHIMLLCGVNPHNTLKTEYWAESFRPILKKNELGGMIPPNHKLGVLSISKGERMKHIFRATLLVSFTISAATIVYPCTCEIMKPKKKLKEARAVFIGEVVEIGHNDKDNWATVAVKFKVERYWKGIKESYATVVTAPGVCCTCGLKVELGGKYLIYAFDMENGQMETSLCTSASVESSRSIDELKLLGKGKVLKSNLSLSPQTPPNNSFNASAN